MSPETDERPGGRFRRSWPRSVPRLLVGALISGSIGGCGSLSPAVEDLHGREVGTMRFEDAEGKMLALDAPGAIYLVDFWAVGCKPCMWEIPDLLRLQHDLATTGRFRIVSVLFGGWKGSQLTERAKEVGVESLAIVSDPEDWYGKLEVQGFPTKFLVRDGRLLYRTIGAGKSGTYRKWKRVVDNQLAH